ncbi:MAG TPA: TlpA disulfide reductase family protein [Terriglobales bacterium]|jgi:peroxiredoxin|nr:TlpA disulfide reductase family protein [Terriglobales bacterium]
MRSTGDEKAWEEEMAGLNPRTTAPDFTLQTIDGRQFSLREALARGPVLVAFFKISCPTCQYAFPFLQRLYEAHGNERLTIVGVSQNEKKDTAAFIKQYGVTFPVLLDDTNTYSVSNAYGLTHVPSIFWIATDSEIGISSVGWIRKEMEELNQRAAAMSGAGLIPLFRPDEQVADFRAG